MNHVISKENIHAVWSHLKLQSCLELSGKIDIPFEEKVLTITRKINKNLNETAKGTSSWLQGGHKLMGIYELHDRIESYFEILKRYFF